MVSDRAEMRAGHWQDQTIPLKPVHGFEYGRERHIIKDLRFSILCRTAIHTAIADKELSDLVGRQVAYANSRRASPDARKFKA